MHQQQAAATTGWTPMELRPAAGQSQATGGARRAIGAAATLSHQTTLHHHTHQPSHHQRQAAAEPVRMYGPGSSIGASGYGYVGPSIGGASDGGSDWSGFGARRVDRVEAARIPAQLLQWDPALDSTSSRQFRPRGGEGPFFAAAHLHPPAATARRASSNEAKAAPSALTMRSQLRYHPAQKPALPPLNRATYQKLLVVQQPLLSACVAGRRRCSMSKWRDELLIRKINPHGMGR